MFERFKRKRNSDGTFKKDVVWTPWNEAWRYKMSEEFGPNSKYKLSLIVPQRPILSVVEGAAYFGITGSIIDKATRAIIGEIQKNKSKYNLLSKMLEIKKGTSGNMDMDQFLLQQQLQNQKFQLDMALIQAKNAALVPRNQPQSAESILRLAEAEKTMTEAGELTNKEVQGIARMIFGTGFRA